MRRTSIIDSIFSLSGLPLRHKPGNGHIVSVIKPRKGDIIAVYGPAPDQERQELSRSRISGIGSSSNGASVTPKAWHSALESVLNTASGFVLSVVAGEFIFPAVGLPISHEQNVAAVSLFTIISVVRSYVWRRLFNHAHRKGWL